MNPTSLSQTDLLGLVIGFIFTLLIFSYLLGDNPLFRIASHIFVGAAAGYAAVITIYNVILPQLIFPLFYESPQEQYLSIILLIPSLFLFTKVTPLRKAGNWVMAILVGIGAAAAVGGAVTGTLLPQITSTVYNQAGSQGGVWGIVNGGIIVLGTLATLIYFHFGAAPRSGHTTRRHIVIEYISTIGQIFIAVTFGVLFAGVYLASLAALIERLNYLWEFITQIGLGLISGR